MSTPRFLTLPPGTRSRTVAGTFAALEAEPVTGVAERWPALLLPGYTGSKEDFIAILQTLTQAGHRVVAADMRGQHETPGPPDPDAYSLEALGADVATLLKSFGDDPLHLVGHSFGGLVAQTALLQGVRPASLTLMSSGPGATTGSSREEALIALQALADGGTEGLWRLIEPLHAERPEEIMAFLKRRMLGNSPEGMVTMAKELLSFPDRIDELAQIAVPMLVLCGERDDAWPPAVQASMADRLGAAKVVIPGAAHSPAVEAPETTARALIDFWRMAEREQAAGG